MSDPGATKGAEQFPDLFKAYLSRETAADDDPVPAKVLTYDPVTQVATCQILVKVPVDGKKTDPPAVHAAQVLWLAGGGTAAPWSIVGELAKDDVGWLVPAGADTSAWARYGTERSAEGTLRAKSMSDAFFIPGTRPVSSPLPPAAYKAAGLVIRGTIYLGSSAATKAPALNGDVSPPSATLAAWALAVEAALLAAGSAIPPGADFATTVLDVGAITATATKVKAE